MQNYKIDEAFIQILEISGKICRRVLCANCTALGLLNSISESVAELDVCLSHLAYYKRAGAVVPRFADHISIKNATCPLLARPCLQSYYVSPLLNFNLVTGQNMSGKSTYAKGLAHSIIMAQLGCPLSAEDADLYRDLSHRRGC